MVAVMVAVVVLVLLIAVMVHNLVGQVEKFQENDENRNKTAFGAWVKVTGNPKKLTYDEWKALSKKGLLPKEEGSGADGEVSGEPEDPGGEPEGPAAVEPAAPETGEAP